MFHLQLDEILKVEETGWGVLNCWDDRENFEVPHEENIFENAACCMIK